MFKNKTDGKFYFIKNFAIIFCVVFLFFGFIATATAATYYVANSGNDACSGTSATTGSSGSCAWKTINKVNLSSFAPGDSILFNRGDTWRETLTPPSSGTSGSPITFGAYGTGEIPVFTGADLITGWTSYAVAGPALFSKTLDTDQATGAADRNYRQPFTVAANSSTIKIRLRAATTAAWVIDGVGIGLQQVGCIATSMTRITFNGGSSAVTIAQNTYVDSDTIAFPVTAGSTYLVNVHMTARNLRYTNGGITMYYDDSYVDESQIADPTAIVNAMNNTDPNFRSTIDFIDTVFGADQVIYQASHTGVPKMVYDNQSRLTLQASTAAVATNLGSYYYASNVVYINASDGSNPSTNGRVYEIAERDQNVDVSNGGVSGTGKDYLTFQDLELRQTYGDNDTMGGVWNIGTGNQFFRIKAHNFYRHGICLYAGSKDSLIEDSVIYDGANSSPVAIYGTDGRPSTNNIVRYNTLHTGGNGNVDIIIHDSAQHNIVEYNDMYADTPAPGALVYGYSTVPGTTHSNIIRYNYLHGVATSAIQFLDHANEEIYGNIIECGDQPYCIDLYGSTGTSVYNNTIYAPAVTSSLLTVRNGATGTTIENNIIYGGKNISVAADSQSGFISDSNIFYNPSGVTWTWGATGYTTLANWRLNSSQDANSINADPKFTSVGTSYSLLSSSPAINAGISLGDAYKNAIYPGSTWPASVTIADQSFRGSGWEIGVYIYPVPRTPTIGSATAQSTSSIRWSFTDNADDETGFKIYDATNASVASSATTNLSYLDETGLSSNTQYAGRYATAYNSYGESVASSPATSKYTLANTPEAPSVGGTTSTTLNVNPVSGGAESAMAIYAEQGSLCDGSGGLGYVQANGSIDSSVVWQSDATWSDITVINLSTVTQYSFCVKAKNGDGIETEFGSSANATTSSSSKDITAFSFPQGAATINGTAISVTVPYGTNVTNLVATFTTTGSSVKVGLTTQTSGVTPNDFTNPVTYVVTAADTSTKSYTVTVTIGTAPTTASGGAAYLLLLTPPPPTAASLQQEIQRLQALVRQFQLTSTAGQTTTPIFTKALKLGDTDPDVQRLQQFLNTHGYQVSATGPGSQGNETTRFGYATRNALIRFQEANRDQILTPVGLTKGTGRFAKMTITFVNGLMRVR